MECQCTCFSFDCAVIEADCTVLFDCSVIEADYMLWNVSVLVPHLIVL